jgi:Ion channel
MSSVRETRLGATVLARTEYRFGLLLLLLLATFVLLMTGSTSKGAGVASVALTGGTLVAALFAAGTSPNLRRLGAGAAVIAFVAVLSVAGFGESRGEGVTALINAALVGLAGLAVARSVLRRRVFDVRTILAGLCVYVLLGMQWAFIYNTIGGFQSDPFFAQPVNATSADYLYFSFITQATVGYGDLTAAGNPGRACSVLEALTGQIYLVTIVALLVSRLKPRDRGSEPSTET